MCQQGLYKVPASLMVFGTIPIAASRPDRPPRIETRYGKTGTTSAWAFPDALLWVVSLDGGQVLAIVRAAHDVDLSAHDRRRTELAHLGVGTLSIILTLTLIRVLVHILIPIRVLVLLVRLMP